jgi:hypothetical protein
MGALRAYMMEGGRGSTFLAIVTSSKMVISNIQNAAISIDSRSAYVTPFSTI